MFDCKTCPRCRWADFENAEGNLQLSNAQLAFLGDKLQKSRMQRDLSDSTVSRNVGGALAHHVLAYEEVQVGLSRVALHRRRHAERRSRPPPSSSPSRSRRSLGSTSTTTRTNGSSSSPVGARSGPPR